VKIPIKQTFYARVLLLKSFPEPLAKRNVRQASLWILFASACVIVGLYPLAYLLAPGKIALLLLKSEGLVNNWLWKAGFITHILAGGIALTVGWSQFIPQWRSRFLAVHRALGKVYVIAVIVSAIAAISIAPFSTTGTIASIGFGSLGVIWLASTILAWRCIHQRNWQQHERLMTYSYAACFAAVTLRFWLPTLIGVFQLKFSTAYPIVAWLSWVPNLVIAFWINSQRQEKPN